MNDLNLLSPKLEPREKVQARQMVILSLCLLAVTVYLVLSYLALNAERRMLQTELATLGRTVQESSEALSSFTEKQPTYAELQERVQSLEVFPSDPSLPGKVAEEIFLKAAAGVQPLAVRARRDVNAGTGKISVTGQASSARAAEQYADVLKRALGVPRVDMVSLDREVQENALALYRFTLELTLEGWK
ncbi:MAG: hypothetical protein IMW97_05335 [Firmicutes bacterium]|nr:hypothetical protein [Candidatus Fermentithermobacillaceae bacterium]